MCLFLTEEAIRRLSRIIITSPALKQCQTLFEEAGREANLGRSYIECAESQINDSRAPESLHNQLNQSLEQRKVKNLNDIQRKKTLKQEYNTRNCALSYLRTQADEAFEHVMVDAGLLNKFAEFWASPGATLYGTLELDEQDVMTPEALDEYGIPRSLLTMTTPEVSVPKVDVTGQSLQESSVPGSKSDAANTRSDVMDATFLKDGSPSWSRSELRKAQEEHQEAWEALCAAGNLFERRKEAYERDIAQYADGPQYSRLEIDLFHVQLGRQLTTKLREAEEEYDRTQARAKLMGILADSIISDPYDDDYDGYCESRDPARHINMVDREFIEEWLANIVGWNESESDASCGSSAPEPEWDANSVNISDSCSVYDDDPRRRRRIDRWQKHQESLRKRLDIGTQTL